MKKLLVLSALIAAGLTPTATLSAADGEKLFRRCKACHAADKEQNKVGPYLKGVYGRKVGAVEGYRYSDAMLAADFVWDDAALDGFLANPKKHTPGTKMAFPGLRKPADRAVMIDYLKSVSQ